MSPAQQAAYTSALIGVAGGDVSKVHTSYSMAKNGVNDEIAGKYKSSWVPPEFASLHWDWKLMQCLDIESKKEERLAVYIGDQDNVNYWEYRITSREPTKSQEKLLPT
ncbi:hypothetical protein SNE40_011652 [Patella caerulea]|uniref:Uncharacterized protein n=1 Tax=Patella caerulea TaxID=87958 RepID=A0AAN8PPL2_PATCE